ncbi:MAG: GNAT family N-acetyltransferase [Clostridia bacterium]|nr:GNAT family N-acetyltransferase [Clostridia bacterium]
MEIRRLNASDYDALLYVLNTSFAAVRSRPVDFLRGHPKMWGRDDAHMGRHLGAFEDGQLVAAVGIYPLELHVGEAVLRFATTGNVATLPSYAGRGYFSRLFSLAMEEAERVGYDALRLGGQKQRYGRFGFEDCGTVYSAELTEKNRAAVPEVAYAPIAFEPLCEESVLALRYIRTLTEKATCYVKRFESEGERDTLAVLRSKYGEAYLVKRDGTPIGYLCAADGGQTVTELRAEAAEDFLFIACAWQKSVRSAITLQIAPWMHTELRALSRVCERLITGTPSKFRFLKLARVVDAFLKLKHKSTPLPEGSFSLFVEGCGLLRMTVDATGAYCTRAEEGEADLTLDRAEAAKLLFGPLPTDAFSGLPAVARAWLPLPLAWCFLDVV